MKLLIEENILVSKKKHRIFSTEIDGLEGKNTRKVERNGTVDETYPDTGPYLHKTTVSYER